MKYYFNNDAKAWPVASKVNPQRPVPTTDAEKDKLVDDLQDAKVFKFKYNK